MTEEEKILKWADRVGRILDYHNSAMSNVCKDFLEGNEISTIKQKPKRIPRKLKKLAAKSHRICLTNDSIVLYGADYPKDGVVFEYSYGYRKRKFKSRILLKRKVVECFLIGMI